MRRAAHPPRPPPLTRTHPAQDNIRTALKKLTDAESALEKRLAEVETRVEKRVSDSVDSKVHKRVADSFMPAIEARLAASGRSWRAPFVVLLIIILGLSVMALMKYRRLMKTHLL